MKSFKDQKHINQCWELMKQNCRAMYTIWCMYCDVKGLYSEEEIKEEASRITTQEAIDLITSLEECWDGDEHDEFANLYTWIDDTFQTGGDFSWLRAMFCELFSGEI